MSRFAHDWRNIIVILLNTLQGGRGGQLLIPSGLHIKSEGNQRQFKRRSPSVLSAVTEQFDHVWQEEPAHLH